MPYYKYENDYLLICDDMLTFPDGLQLSILDKNKYTFPINDWYYFDDKKTAYEFFGIPLEEEDTEISLNLMK